MTPTQCNRRETVPRREPVQVPLTVPAPKPAKPTPQPAQPQPAPKRVPAPGR
jgi:hypothetical protein